MKHEHYFTCDLGGERHETRQSVRNEVSFLNGDSQAVFADICDRHYLEARRLLDETFPRNLKAAENEKSK